MKTIVAMCGLLLGFVLMSSTVGADEKDSPFPKPDMTAVKEMFQKLDSNGDGKLSLEEFAKFEKMRADMPAPESAPFGKFGGKIDPEKLKMLKEKFGGKIDPEKLKMLKEKFGGKFDPEKLKQFKDKQNNPE